MLCKCGSEITNVPDHLRDLASWMCQKCTNTAPRGVSFNLEQITPQRESFPRRQRKAA